MITFLKVIPPTVGSSETDQFGPVNHFVVIFNELTTRCANDDQHQVDQLRVGIQLFLHSGFLRFIGKSAGWNHRSIPRLCPEIEFRKQIKRGIAQQGGVTTLLQSAG